ncbi:MAG: hypothetical protein PHV28_09055 [Kiritimatiellae bacterium]|nr:hypothetical protein [Kiritimatiellia bacterium]
MKRRLVMAIAAMAAGTIFGGVAWTNDMAVLTFDAAGRVLSLKERESGRELVSKDVFLFASTPAKCLYPNKLEALGDGRFRWSFPSDSGSVTLKIRSFGLGWSFEVVEFGVRDAENLYLAWLTPTCRKWTGRVLNMISDDDSGVIVRSPEPETGIHSRDRKSLFLHVQRQIAPFVGRRGGIVAGPRAKLQEAMRQMTLDAGVYRTTCSGAWSLGNQTVRGSYLFTEMSPGSSDDWIDLSERGGFDTIHMHNAGSRGHFTPTSVLYPRGYDDFKLCADLIHDAGMRVGMHTLTACINPKDPWITPVCRTDLIVRCTHKLAKPLAEDDTEMFVEEQPEKTHDVIHSYGSNGNSFLIGTELVQYTGIRREKPYAFTGIVRGAFKTKKGGTYPAGTEAKYLLQRYDAFYPAPNSRLAEELAEAIATAFNTGRLDQIYFDGSEGLGSRYAIDSVRLGIARKLGPDALIEGSCSNEMNWWYLSRYGAWDHSLWGAKLFQDQHSRDIDYIRKGNLLEPQMGWWKPRQADGRARGHFLDEMEYFAAKNAAANASMSLQGVDMRRQRITPFAVTRQLTVLGWYERFRMANAFTGEALALFGEQGVDARLRQAADGRWLCRRSDARVQRVTGVGDGSEKWTVAARGNCAAAIRVEALYAAGKDAPPMKLLSADDRLDVKGADVPKVDAKLEHGQSEHGKTFVLTAANRGDTRRGAWASYAWTTERPYRDAKGMAAYGFWIKGDGKGETLCFQLGCGREYSGALSDHYVKIDFTGWRHMDLLTRERDAGRMEEFVWPYSNEHNMRFIASSLDMAHIAKLSFFLNDVPPGETATVEVSEVTAMTAVKNDTERVAVVVNGVRFPLPFVLESGEYAELEDGVWTRYTEQGVPFQRAYGAKAELRAGDNAIEYEGVVEDGAARAEIAVFAFGQPFPAVRDLATLGKDARRRLAYEAVEPVFYAPKQGFDGRVPVNVRPGEKAYLELRVTGAIKNPSLAVKDGSKRVWTFPVTLEAKDRLFCRDGVRWYVLREKGLDSSHFVARGELSEPLPTLEKSTRFVVGSSDPYSAAAEVDIVKRYGGDQHPGLGRKLTYGQGLSGRGDTEGMINSNWKVK